MDPAEIATQVLTISTEIRELSKSLSTVAKKLDSLVKNELGSHTDRVRGVSRNVTWINDPNSITWRTAQFIKQLGSCNYMALTKNEVREFFGSTNDAANVLEALANYDLIRMQYNQESDLYEIEQATNLLAECPPMKLSLGINQMLSWPRPDPEDLEIAKMRLLAAMSGN